MKKQKNPKVIWAMFTGFLLITFLSVPQLSAGPKGPPKPPAPDPVMDKLNLILEKLEQIPPVWSQILPASERFELVLDGKAVLDKETGLVWERTPEGSPRTQRF